MTDNPSPDDWRRQGQEAYLSGATWEKRSYQSTPSWDHDHCEFCYTKFSTDASDLNIGYLSVEGSRWVCESCFADFEQEMGWRLLP